MKSARRTPSSVIILLLVAVLCLQSLMTQAFQQSSTMFQQDRSSTRLSSLFSKLEEDSTRRNFVSVGFFGFLTATTAYPGLAMASPPVTAKDTDSLLAKAQRARRPKPPKVLRRKLSLDFAVLLMRSSYNALDEIDCVAMVSASVFNSL
jgi:hypothetical protein